MDGVATAAQEGGKGAAMSITFLDCTGHGVPISKGLRSVDNLVPDSLVVRKVSEVNFLKREGNIQCPGREF